MVLEKRTKNVIGKVHFNLWFRLSKRKALVPVLWQELTGHKANTYFSKCVIKVRQHVLHLYIKTLNALWKTIIKHILVFDFNSVDRMIIRNHQLM